MSEKIPIGFKIDDKTLDFIDEIAEKDQRSRASFFIFAALKYAKERKSELEQEKDKKEGWE
jgi:uncharacterized protein (DUF1778 family)